jgi:hypothetical protein
LCFVKSRCSEVLSPEGSDQVRHVRQVWEYKVVAFEVDDPNNWDNFVVLSQDGKKGTIFFLHERCFYRWSIEIDGHGFTHTDPRFFHMFSATVAVAGG